MGVLRLDSYDGSIRQLPDLCMQCGAPATRWKSKTFSWFPPWVWVLLFICNVLIFAIVAMILTKRRTISVPLCEEHKNHWLWRQFVIVGGFMAVFVVGIIAVIATSDEGGSGGDTLGGLVCGGALLALVIWLIAAVIVQSTSIRAREISDTSFTLTGVSAAFIQAFEQEWRPSPVRLDESAVERWNQGKRPPPAGRRNAEDADGIQRPAEDADRAPPDAFQEGTS